MKGLTITVEEKKLIEEFFQKKGLSLDIDLTFEDVALPDEYSEVRSRSEIHDFRVSLARGLDLNIPIVSANMRSVSGAELIIALEREGGLGIVPQDLLLSERLEILEKVLRAECAVIDEPLTIPPSATLKEAKEVMKKFGVSGLLVIDEDKRLLGILSSRDWHYEKDEQRLVWEIMTSSARRNLITASSDVTLDEAARILKKNKIEKLPLLSNERVAGLITARGLFYQTHHQRALRDEKGRFILVGSVGVSSQSHSLKEILIEIEEQRKRGISALLIETARAFSVNTKDTIEAVIKNHRDILLICGNTSNPEGVKFLFELGVDCVKVGQGPGMACTTREVGAGLPQLTAIALASVIAKKYGRHIIADGGIKGPADMAKALIAGADAVMLGNLLVGVNESRSMAYPFYSKEFDAYITVKDYYGSASFEAQRERKSEGSLDIVRRPEGRKIIVPVVGSLSDRISDLIDGLRSVMSYFGARSVKDLQEKGYFRRQSQEGYREGVKSR